jgi:Tfp pilus assembly protein PilN
VETARENYTAALNRLTNTSNKMNEDLNATVDNVVKNLDVGNLSISGGMVNLTGRAASEQEVLQYVRELTSTGRFEEITISNLRKVNAASGNDTTEMNYNLILRLEEDK